MKRPTNPFSSDRPLAHEFPIPTDTQASETGLVPSLRVKERLGWRSFNFTLPSFCKQLFAEVNVPVSTVIEQTEDCVPWNVPHHIGFAYMS
ncbi:unannotated protein [freshwater metagenome]|uniref:Unannotated protein n=1 Tax=freshwater metagenome TaxID=449393 RepID=A0A6J6BF06_9ZZZZ